MLRFVPVDADTRIRRRRSSPSLADVLSSRAAALPGHALPFPTSPSTSLSAIEMRATGRVGLRARRVPCRTRKPAPGEMAAAHRPVRGDLLATRLRPRSRPTASVASSQLQLGDRPFGAQAHRSALTGRRYLLRPASSPVSVFVEDRAYASPCYRRSCLRGLVSRGSIRPQHWAMQSRSGDLLDLEQRCVRMRFRSNPDRFAALPFPSTCPICCGGKTRARSASRNQRGTRCSA